MLEKWPWGNVEPRPGEHEAWSLAVSAKRAADALDEIVRILKLIAEAQTR